MPARASCATPGKHRALPVCSAARRHRLWRRTDQAGRITGPIWFGRLIGKVRLQQSALTAPLRDDPKDQAFVAWLHIGGLLGFRTGFRFGTTVRNGIRRTPWTRQSRLPLSGITVVSLEQAIAAPLASRHLADWGARVIKIERPGKGDFCRDYDYVMNGMSSQFAWTNRSKESLALDVKSQEGKARARRAAAAGRCVSAKSGARRSQTARPRCRDAGRTLPSPDRLRHFRLWQRWPLQPEKGLRPAGPM